MTKLDKLLMKDHHHIARYNVEFNEGAALTGYNDHALYTGYYKCLAPRPNDDFVLNGKPTILAGLRTRAQACIGKENSKNALRGLLIPHPPLLPHHILRRTIARSPRRTASPGPSLQSDGKRLPEEKWGGKKNNLCLICASKYYFSDKCPSRKLPAKAYASDLEPAADDSLGTAPKAESLGSQN